MIFSRKHFRRRLRHIQCGIAALTAFCYLALSIATVSPSLHHHPLEYEASTAANHSDAPPADPDSFGHEHADHCALCMWHALGQNAPTPPPDLLQAFQYVQTLIPSSPLLITNAARTGGTSPRGPPHPLLTSVG